MAHERNGHLINEVSVGWVCSRCLRVKYFANRFDNVECELVNPYAAPEVLDAQLKETENKLEELLIEIRDSLQRIEDALAPKEPKHVEVVVSTNNQRYVGTIEEFNRIISDRTEAHECEIKSKRDKQQ